MLDHPPIANGVACVDFDGTIVPWGPLDDSVSPSGAVIRQMRKLAETHKVFIFTSRLSPTWLRAEFPQLDPMTARAQQYEYVASLLRDHGIPFYDITAEKIPAEVYFDDKAVRVHEDTYPLNAAINDWLVQRGRC